MPTGNRSANDTGADRQAGPESGASQTPFDPYEYYFESKRPAEKSITGLVGLSRSAIRLARQASPRLFAVVGGLQVAGVLLMALQLFLGKVAIERVLSVSNESASLSSAIPPLVGLVAATAVSGLTSATLTQLQRLLGERVARQSWARVLGVTTSVNLETFESSEFFDDLQRVKTLAVTQPLTLTQGLFALGGGLLGVIGISIAMLAIEPLLLPVILLGAGPLWLISRRTGRIEFDFTKRMTPLLRLRGYLTETLTGRAEAKEIRVFGLGATLHGRWSHGYEQYLDEFGRHIRRRLSLASMSALVMVVGLSSAMAILLALVESNRMTLGAAGAALLAVRLLGGRVQEVFAGISRLFESSLFLRDFDAFLARRPDAGARAGHPVPKPFELLQVENVGFRYPGTDRDVLQDVSLSIQAGEIVALVGENGSGKTTLAKLLGGMFEPTSGRILWDGRELGELDREQLREHVGVIFQDFVRYQLSARENIGFGRPARLEDLDAIEAAARRADVHRHIECLPRGYETGLGKEFAGGFDLSGGQWQRIALARAFFRDAGFLVLDEPTASLDARSEFELFEQVAELAGNRSVLLISHRFSTVKSADRILVIHEGELVEQGSHDELMALGGRYAEMFELQARSYR